MLERENMPFRNASCACVPNATWNALPECEHYRDVPEVELPGNEAVWPRPTNRGPRLWWPAAAHHVGVLTRTRYELPEGDRSIKATPA
jgi:hypothetical protein